MIQTNIVFVPNWIKDIADQHQVGLKDLLNPEGFCKLLSLEAQIEFLTFQMISVPPVKPGELINDSLNIERYTGDTAQAKTVEREVRARLQTPEYGRGLIERLALTESDSRLEYELIDLKDGTVCLVLGGGFTQINESEYFQLVQNILKLFYTYEEPYQVVNKPIFRTYLTLMKRNRRATMETNGF